MSTAHRRMWQSAAKPISFRFKSITCSPRQHGLRCALPILQFPGVPQSIRTAARVRVAGYFFVQGLLASRCMIALLRVRGEVKVSLVLFALGRKTAARGPLPGTSLRDVNVPVVEMEPGLHDHAAAGPVVDIGPISQEVGDVGRRLVFVFGERSRFRPARQGPRLPHSLCRRTMPHRAAIAIAIGRIGIFLRTGMRPSMPQMRLFGRRPVCASAIQVRRRRAIGYALYWSRRFRAWCRTDPPRLAASPAISARREALIKTS